MQFKGSHLLSVDQLTSEDINTVYNLASGLEVISTRKKATTILQGAVLANLFFEPSTRTRLSFGTAFSLLGGSVVDMTQVASSSLAKGESFYDTSRVISSYVDIMVVRHPQEDSVAQFAAASPVPVINGGNGTGEHPTQALLDIYTIIKESGKHSVADLKNLTICFAGDLKHGRTVHSLAKLLSLLSNIEFRLVSPETLRLPEPIIALLKERNNSVIETDDLMQGIKNADVVYMTRIQEERFPSQKEYIKHAGKYSIDKLFYEKYCKPHALLMHPLPRDSRLKAPELSHDLNDHERLVIFKQSRNGVPVRMALFCLVLGIEIKVFEHLRDVEWFYPQSSL